MKHRIKKPEGRTVHNTLEDKIKYYGSCILVALFMLLLLMLMAALLCWLDELI